MNQVTLKKAWKASGVGNECFNPLPVLRPNLLDQWTMARIQMPERGYEKFTFSKLLRLNFKGDKPIFKPAPTTASEFGEPSLDLLNEEKREKVIKLIKSGFPEGRQKNRPPPSDEAVPQFLKHTKMFLPVFKATDVQTKHFGFPKHNTWDQFINTVRSTKSELASCKIQVKKRCCER